MALKGVDQTRAIRTPAERLALVQAIAAAPAHEMELDWVEWKSTYDLLQAERQFDIGRHLIGFANRQPDAAAAVCGGCGYLVVGVEPANLQGIQPIDSAKLSKAIDAYTGGSDGPRWSPDYIDCQGRTVLVITTEPPSWGDHIHSLRRGFDKTQAGAIFVRRKGETEQANPGEIAMLENRAVRRTARINIGLRWTGGTVEIIAAGATEKEVADWAEREKAELLGHLHREPSAADQVSVFAGFASKDERTPEDYQRQVEKYINAAVPTMMNRIIGTAARRSNRLGVTLENHTDSNFSDVRCELRVAGPAWSMVNPLDAKDLVEPFPARPKPYGRPRILDMLGGLGLGYVPALGTPRRYRGYSDNSNSTRIVFDPIALRPQAEVPLEPFAMVVGQKLAGSTVEVAWTATATNADGVASGVLELPVSRKVFDISAALTKATDPE